MPFRARRGGCGSRLLLFEEDHLERYTKTSGRDASDIDFYTSFAYWKLACIVEGVYARYLAGAMGSGREGFEMFKVQVERSAATAAEIAQRVS